MNTQTITPERPIVSADPPDPANPAAGGDGSANPGASPADGGDGEFMPGKYKTPEDAIRDYDKRMGGIAQKVDDVLKKLDKVSAPAPAKGIPTDQVNPETGQPFTSEEIANQWNESFQTDPVGTTLQLLEIHGKKTTEKLVNQIQGNLIWSGFLANNPDMNTEENIKIIGDIFTAYPNLGKKPDALMKAKEIALSSGETVEEKYDNWILGKKGKKGDPPPNAPPMGSQSGISKGGKPIKDQASGFFDTKDGGSIFG